jgi:hypothetical protein
LVAEESSRKFFVAEENSRCFFVAEESSRRRSYLAGIRKLEEISYRQKKILGFSRRGRKFEEFLGITYLTQGGADNKYRLLVCCSMYDVRMCLACHHDMTLTNIEHAFR